MAIRKDAGLRHLMVDEGRRRRDGPGLTSFHREMYGGVAASSAVLDLTVIMSAVFSSDVSDGEDPP